MYAALLCFLQLSRQQCEPLPARPMLETSGISFVSLLDEPLPPMRPVWVSKHASLQVLMGFGERLLATLCQDFSGGHDVCKVKRFQYCK